MHGPTLLRITLRNAKGEEIAVRELPIVVESPKLLEALAELTQAVRDLKDLVELTRG